MCEVSLDPNQFMIICSLDKQNHAKSLFELKILLEIKLSLLAREKRPLMREILYLFVTAVWQVDVVQKSISLYVLVHV